MGGEVHAEAMMILWLVCLGNEYSPFPFPITYQIFRRVKGEGEKCK